MQGVILADIDAEGACIVASESKYHAQHPKYRAVSLKVDVSEDNSVQTMVRSAISEFGRIDYFVHSAGVSPSAPAVVLDRQRA